MQLTPSSGLWVACPDPVVSGQGKKGSPSGREHCPQENPWQPVPGTHMCIDSHLPPTPSPSPGRPSWSAGAGGADGQLSLKNPSSSHTWQRSSDMGSGPAGLRGGLVSSGPWSSALGRLARPAMLLHGRLQRASGCTVCVSPRRIISFCWAPRCQNRALFTAPVPNQSLIHTV